MILVSSMKQLKEVSLTLTPSLKARRSMVLFQIEENQRTFKPGIHWCELWQNKEILDRDTEEFNFNDENSLGWIFDDRMDSYFIKGVVKEGNKVKVILYTPDV